MNLTPNELKKQTAQTLPNHIISKLTDPSNTNDASKQIPKIPLSILSNFWAKNPEIVSKLDDQDTVQKLSRISNALQDQKVDLNDIQNKILHGKAMKIWYIDTDDLKPNANKYQEVELNDIPLEKCIELARTGDINLPKGIVNDIEDVCNEKVHSNNDYDATDAPIISAISPELVYHSESKKPNSDPM